MNTTKNVPRNSTRIGRNCCPECNSLQMAKRKHWLHCEHCGHNFTVPGKIKAPPPPRDRSIKTVEFAGPAYYRGLRWGEFAESIA